MYQTSFFHVQLFEYIGMPCVVILQIIVVSATVILLPIKDDDCLISCPVVSLVRASVMSHFRPD